MRRIFVISDLHLGGRPDEVSAEGIITRHGFQICHAYGELIRFVDWLRELANDTDNEEIELIINGDIVDFLAVDEFDDPEIGAQLWTVDEAHAVIKLNKIVERTRVDGKRGVFEAMGDFLREGSRLTLLIGNHDVELALPKVRQRLMELLDYEGGRLRFVYDGEAYTVGRVLIEHGNRYDPWNMIDHSALRQERSVRSRGLPVYEKDRPESYFIPPAGTHLVIGLMNRIKDRYHFVDLLKPEADTVIPLLFALEPGRKPTIDEILQDVDKIFKIAMKHQDTELKNGNLSYKGAEGVELKRILREKLGNAVEYFYSEDGSTLEAGSSVIPRSSNYKSGQLSFKSEMRKGEQWLKKKYDQLAELEGSASKFYDAMKIRNAKDDEKKLHQLHVTLRAVGNSDHSFEIDHEISPYLDAARDIALKGGFEAIIYGHTHLPKKVPIYDSEQPSSGVLPKAWYLNTGTWSDVMRIPEELVADYSQARKELLKFVEALRNNDFSRYVKRYLSFVEVLVDLREGGHIKEVSLHSFCGRGNERSDPLTNRYSANDTST
ncbi:MAG: metallophosphoesterase [Pseudobdellovibrionaceae bacterium]